MFDGPEDYHHRIDDPATGITPETLMFMRDAELVGYPGAAEVVNMRPPAHLVTDGVHALPCIGDGRQSGTSGSPSILDAGPEAIGSFALLKDNDRVRIDLKRGTADVLIAQEELTRRCAELETAGGDKYPASRTPWQAIQRATVGRMNTGAILEGAETFQRIAQTIGVPRDNHWRG